MKNNLFSRGHKIINAERLADFIKKIIPNETNFTANFLAYKIAENEDKFLQRDNNILLEVAKAIG